MREKYLWLAVGVLLALTLGQACYIYEEQVLAVENSSPPPVQPDIQRSLYAEKSYDAQWEELEKWRDKVRASLGSGAPLLERDFDVFFNDRFFSGRFSPFTEMDRIRLEMSGQFGSSEKLLFNDYWDKWFEQRMRLREFGTDVARTDGAVTITIVIPGLSGETADVNITEDRIRISFSSKSGSEEKLVAGVVRKESYKSYVKILPVPADAAAGTGKVKVEGDRIAITFDLKKTGGKRP
jgi:HSP20 family molecular chaperone IbpA